MEVPFAKAHYLAPLSQPAPIAHAAPSAEDRRIERAYRNNRLREAALRLREEQALRNALYLTVL